MLKQNSNLFSFPLPFTILMETSQQQHLPCFFILWALWLRSLTSMRSSDRAVATAAGYNSDRKYILALSIHVKHIPNSKTMDAGGKIQLLKHMNSVQSLGCLHMSQEQNHMHNYLCWQPGIHRYMHNYGCFYILKVLQAVIESCVFCSIKGLWASHAAVGVLRQNTKAHCWEKVD